jgi:hypothetical protein
MPEEYPSHVEEYRGGPMRGKSLKIFGAPLTLEGYMLVEGESSEQKIIFEYTGDYSNALAA